MKSDLERICRLSRGWHFANYCAITKNAKDDFIFKIGVFTGKQSTIDRKRSTLYQRSGFKENTVNKLSSASSVRLNLELNCMTELSYTH